MTFLSFQYPLVDNSRPQSHAETCDKDNGKWKVLFKTDESHEKEEDARQNSPQRPLGEILHGLRITFVLQINPYKDQRTCKWHHSNKACSGG